MITLKVKNKGMNNLKTFFQIDASIDPKIIGRSECPISVEIKDDLFSKQSRKYTLNINEYFKDQKDLYDYFPKNMKGKMYQRKKNQLI